MYDSKMADNIDFIKQYQYIEDERCSIYKGCPERNEKKMKKAIYMSQLLEKIRKSKNISKKRLNKLFKSMGDWKAHFKYFGESHEYTLKHFKRMIYLIEKYAEYVQDDDENDDIVFDDEDDGTDNDFDYDVDKHNPKEEYYENNKEDVDDDYCDDDEEKEYSQDDDENDDIVCDVEDDDDLSDYDDNEKDNDMDVINRRNLLARFPVWLREGHSILVNRVSCVSHERAKVQMDAISNLLQEVGGGVAQLDKISTNDLDSIREILQHLLHCLKIRFGILQESLRNYEKYLKNISVPVKAEKSHEEKYFDKKNDENVKDSYDIHEDHDQEDDGDLSNGNDADNEEEDPANFEEEDPISIEAAAANFRESAVLDRYDVITSVKEVLAATAVVSEDSTKADENLTRKRIIDNMSTNSDLESRDSLEQPDKIEQYSDGPHSIVETSPSYPLVAVMTSMQTINSRLERTEVIINKAEKCEALKYLGQFSYASVRAELGKTDGKCPLKDYKEVDAKIHENKLKDQFIAEHGENSRKNLKLFPLKDLFPDSVFKDTPGDANSGYAGAGTGHEPDMHGGNKTETPAGRSAQNSLGSCGKYRTDCTLSELMIGSRLGQVRPWVSVVADQGYISGWCRPYDPGGDCEQSTRPDKRGRILSSLDMCFSGRPQMSQVMKNPWEKINETCLTDKMCREIVVPYWLLSSIVGGEASGAQYRGLSHTLWDPGGC